MFIFVSPQVVLGIQLAGTSKISSTGSYRTHGMSILIEMILPAKLSNNG